MAKSLSGNATTQQEINQEFVAAFEQQGDTNLSLQQQIDAIPIVTENESVILWPNDVSKILAYSNGVKNTYSIPQSIFNFHQIEIRYHITDADTLNETQTALTFYTKSLDQLKPISFSVSNYRKNSNTQINSFGSV